MESNIGGGKHGDDWDQNTPASSMVSTFLDTLLGHSAATLGKMTLHDAVGTCGHLT